MLLKLVSISDGSTHLIHEQVKYFVASKCRCLIWVPHNIFVYEVVKFSSLFQIKVGLYV